MFSSSVAFVLLLVGVPLLVSGHGNLMYPYAWWDVERAGWYVDEEGHRSDIGCGVLDLPEDMEFYSVNHGRPDCAKYWFSHGMKIPGEPTISGDLALPDVTCQGHDVHNYPWGAPGTSIIYGSCGTLGGKPNGCHDDGVGELGDCCSPPCTVFAMGKRAEEYAWVDAPVTLWPKNSIQEVVWYVRANHAGGYHYRLCKVPHDQLEMVSEECFQAMPLDFVGDTTLINYMKDEPARNGTEMPAIQGTEGMHPPGSMWRAIPVPPKSEEGGHNDFHITDYVQVPADIESGEYVLSMRWDAKCSQQIWTGCANILIA